MRVLERFSLRPATCWSLEAIGLYQPLFSENLINGLDEQRERAPKMNRRKMRLRVQKLVSAVRKRRAPGGLSISPLERECISATPSPY